jgi:hypothetical protein
MPGPGRPSGQRFGRTDGAHRRPQPVGPGFYVLNKADASATAR